MNKLINKLINKYKEFADEPIVLTIQFWPIKLRTIKLKYGIKLNNKELLELIKTDIKAFNSYKEKYHWQKINFSNANLKGLNLEYANLGDVNLQYADLSYATLKNAYLKKANLQKSWINNTDFENANLKGVNLQVRDSLKSANFSGAKLENATITLTKENILLEFLKGVEL
jgi:uncharacterized protein YjbI with pentapeptide repeats